MRVKFLVSTVFLLGVSLLAADPVTKLADKWQKRINTAQMAYTEATTKAENALFYTKQKANADRLKILRAVLTDATKAGDFDAATTVKGLVSSAEESGATRGKPKNAVKFGGHEYALLEEKVTWHVAKRQCEEMGGHLVTFESEQEQAFVLAACRSARQLIWIGVSNDDDISEFRWVTGSAAVVDKSWTFDNGSETEFAVALAFWPGTNSFNDQNLGSQAGFCCEWDR